MKLATAKLSEIGMQEATKGVVLKAAGSAVRELIQRTPSEVTKEALKIAAEKSISLVGQKTGQWATQLAKEAAKEAIQALVKETIKSALQPLFSMLANTALVKGIGGGATSILTGVGTLVVNDIQRQAAEEKKLADEAAAAAKAIEAMIATLRKLIEELQKDLEKMLDSCMQAVSAIFNAADESSNSMKELMHFQPA